jgi:GAF domain-containing protein
MPRGLNSSPRIKAFEDGRGKASPSKRRVDELTRRLADSEEQQRATAEILRLMARSPAESQPTLEAIARHAARLCHARLSNIFLFDGELLHVVAHHGLPSKAIETTRDVSPRRPDNGSAAGRAVLCRAVVQIPDVHADAAYALGDVATAVNYRSLIGVPILDKGAPVGAITVARSRPGPFSDAQVDLLRSFADQAAVAVESARLSGEVQERTENLTEALQQQTATADVLKVISRSPSDLQPVLETIVKTAAELCAAEYAFIARPADGRCHMAAANNVQSDHVRFLLRNPAPIDRDSILGRVTLERRTIHVPDVLLDPEFKRLDWQQVGKQRTVLGVPLVREDALLGVIILARTAVKPFTEKQVDLVTTFADQAVIAIENVRLFEEVQARTAELQEALEYQTATSEVLNVISRSPSQIQPVLDTIVATAGRLCEAHDTHIMLRDEESLRVAAHRGPIPTSFGTLPIGRGWVTGRAVADQKLVHVHDLTAMSDEFPEGYSMALRFGVRTILATPLVRENVALGAIVARRAEVRPFSDKQVAVLQTFADQAVIAIENVRLFDEVQARTQDLAQSVQELQALGEVSHAVNSTLDPERVLSTIVAKAVQLSSTDAGAIYVFSNLRQKFRLRATYGMSEELIQEIGRRSIGPGESYIGSATRHGKAVQVPDLEAEPCSPMRDLVLSAGYRGLLVVPLLKPGRIVGALVVRRRAPGPFPQSTIDLLQTFAAQSVIAIQNARLFSEIEQKSREIEAASRHKSQFLANMSHELRTPLNAVLGFAEMMADGLYGPMPDKALKALERVQANGRHLLGLINDVLDLSKIEAGQLTLTLQDYAVAQVVQTVISGMESLAGAKGLALVAEDHGSVEIVARASGGFFDIAVHDTGPGIILADQQRIFEEFQQVDSSSTRRKGGTGLGLAISKRLIEMHGGALTVESVPGEGSTFRVLMPVRAKERTEAA